MKKILSLMVLGLLMFAGETAWAQCCAGHMAGVSTPGTCAISTGKHKVKKATGHKTVVPAAKTYVCPMDGTTSDKPGKCPKCGMDLIEKQ